MASVGATWSAWRMTSRRAGLSPMRPSIPPSGEAPRSSAFSASSTRLVRSRVVNSSALLIAIAACPANTSENAVSSSVSGRCAQRARHAHELLTHQQRVERRPHAAPGDDLLDHHVVLLARTVEGMLDETGSVDAPALAEVVEPDRRPTLGRSADEILPEGDPVAVVTTARPMPAMVARCNADPEPAVPFRTHSSHSASGRYSQMLHALPSIRSVRPRVIASSTSSRSREIESRLDVERSSSTRRSRTSAAVVMIESGQGTSEKLAAPRAPHYSHVRIDRPTCHPLLLPRRTQRGGALGAGGTTTMSDGVS